MSFLQWTWNLMASGLNSTVALTLASCMILGNFKNKTRKKPLCLSFLICNKGIIIDPIS